MPKTSKANTDFSDEDEFLATQPSRDDFGDMSDTVEEKESVASKKNRTKAKSTTGKKDGSPKKRQRADEAEGDKTQEEGPGPRTKKTKLSNDNELKKGPDVKPMEVSSGEVISKQDRSQWNQEAREIFERYEAKVKELAAKTAKGEPLFKPADPSRLTQLGTRDLRFLLDKQSSVGHMPWYDLLRRLMEKGSALNVKFKLFTNAKTKKTSVKLSVDGVTTTFLSPFGRVTFHRKRSESTRVDAKDPTANSQAWILDMFPFTKEDAEKFGYNSEMLLFGLVFIPLLDRRMAHYLCHNQPEIYERDYKNYIKKPDDLFKAVTAKGGSMRTGMFCETEEDGVLKEDYPLYMASSKLAFKVKENPKTLTFYLLEERHAKIPMAVEEYNNDKNAPLALSVIPHISAATGKWADPGRCYDVDPEQSPANIGHVISINVNPIATEAKGVAGIKTVPVSILYLNNVRVDYYSPGIVEREVDTGDVGQKLLQGKEDEYTKPMVYQVTSLQKQKQIDDELD